MASVPRKVLLAIDGSTQSAEAFDWYFKYVHKPENSVILLHVPEGPTVSMSQGMHLNSGEIQKMIDKENSETSSLQAKYMSKLAEIKVEAAYRTVHGRAGEALVQAARETEAAMVVMGTRGLGRLRRTVLGSVSDYVVHHAHCPVIVCRH